jgi:hypothetical protein
MKTSATRGGGPCAQESILLVTVDVSRERKANQTSVKTASSRRRLSPIPRHRQHYMQDGLRSRTNGSVHKTALQKEADGSIASGVDSAETPAVIEKTDYSLWRLQVEHGRQTWAYITPEQARTWRQSIPEKHHLGLDTVLRSLLSMNHF